MISFAMTTLAIIMALTVDDDLEEEFCDYIHQISLENEEGEKRA